MLDIFWVCFGYVLACVLSALQCFGDIFGVFVWYVWACALSAPVCFGMCLICSVYVLGMFWVCLGVCLVCVDMIWYDFDMFWICLGYVSDLCWRVLCLR